MVIYAVVIMLVGLLFRSFKSDDPMVKKYMMKGLLAKLFGGACFTMVYTFYYTYGGDTMSYFHDAHLMATEFLTDPLNYFSLLFSDTDTILSQNGDFASMLRYDIGTSEWFTVKFTSLAVLLGLNNYFSTTMIFAGLSYVGIWKFFEVLVRRYPGAHRSLAFSLLFVPSVFFWGSGIMKDCIVFGLLGLIIHFSDSLISGRIFKKLMAASLLVLCAYLIFNIKSYVIISLVPAIIIWIIMNFRDNIENRLFRIMLLPVLLVGSIVFVGVSVNFLGQYSDKYNLETVSKSAQDMQKWHYMDGLDEAQIRGRGSSYSLSEFDGSVWGSVKVFFESVNVTYFRPYLWEVENIAMLAAAIESLMVLLFSLFIFMGLGFFRVIKLLNSDSFLLMSLTFAIFFGFAIGFSTYNFGALVRYKIPCMPFYLSALFILQYKVKQIKEKKKLNWQMRKERQRIAQEAARSL